jgi:hypothetical protein
MLLNPVLEHEKISSSIEARGMVVCTLPNPAHATTAQTASLQASGVPISRPGENLDIDAVVRDPTRYFSRPCDVIGDARLNNDQRRRILQSWALDAELMHQAEAENMGGRAGDRAYLREAKLALLALDR